nr:recombinase family protein [uncultured Acetatifactor sp.]
MPEKIIRVIQPTVSRQNIGDNTVTPAKRRVAAYARVSTDEDEQLNSYENQINYYTRYIQSKPEWEFVGLYSDEGISGLNTKKRDGFRQMVEDALNGRIDLILTKSISRFARNTVDSLVTIRQLKEKGVEVYFEKENIYTLDSKGELLITIMSSIAQEESRSISENITWAKRKNMERGKVSMSYGHFLGYEKGEDGKPQIVEKEAEVVRRIYNLYLDGKSVREIARILTAGEVLTPSGKNCNWNVSTIMSILRNEKYKGDALLQKVYTVDFLNKKVVKNTNVLPQYYVENSHPAIIDEETFDMVQAELAKRGGCSRGRRAKSVFDRKVVCGDCGHFYGQKLWYSDSRERVYVWRCTHKYDTEPNCQTPIVREMDLKSAFLATFNQFLRFREGYIAELEKRAETAKPAMAGEIRRYIKSLKTQPETVRTFSESAFAALVDKITVRADGHMAVRYKDGMELSVGENKEWRDSE